MLIDIIVLMLLAMAAFKGYRQGFIVGVFSYLAFIIGLAAAMKLSTVVALRTGDIVNVSDKWMPFLAFVLVFIIVVILVRWLGGLLQSFSKKIMLGWLNRLGGIALFAVLYLSVFAIFLFYLTRMNLITDDSAANSITFPLIKPLGRVAVNAIGEIIPVFKGLFAQLEQFFGAVADKAS